MELVSSLFISTKLVVSYEFFNWSIFGNISNEMNPKNKTDEGQFAVGQFAVGPITTHSRITSRGVIFTRDGLAEFSNTVSMFGVFG